MGTRLNLDIHVVDKAFGARLTREHMGKQDMHTIIELCNSFNFSVVTCAGMASFLIALHCWHNARLQLVHRHVYNGRVQRLDTHVHTNTHVALFVDIHVHE